MAAILIRTAAIQYGTNMIECHVVMSVMTPVGPTTFQQVVPLEETGNLPPDWTDEQLCAAVAEKLNVDPGEVAVVDSQ